MQVSETNIVETELTSNGDWFCFRKARRKDKDASSLCTDEPKLYLEETVLERKPPDIDLRHLVDLPAGLDYNEWLASHSKSISSQMLR